MVAAARQLRGVLPRRQRPVGSGHHVALRLPDQRPELHRHRRAAVRLSGRHPLPRRQERHPAARSAASGQDLRQLRVPGTGLNLGIGFNVHVRQAADGARRAIRNYDNGGEIPVTAARRRVPDHRRLQDADAVSTRSSTCRPRTSSSSAAEQLHAAGRHVQPLQHAARHSTTTVVEYSLRHRRIPTSASRSRATSSGPQFQTPRQIRFGARFAF